MSKPGWRLRLLDSFSLSGPTGEIPLTARKAMAMLAYLSVQRDLTARREVLANLLWENSDPAQARVSLRQAISAIRKVETEPDALIVVESDLIRLSQDLCIDVRQFERLANGDHDAQTEAAAHYRTDFLNGFSLRDSQAFNEWLTIEQARLRQRAVATLNSLMEFSLSPQGDLNEGIAHALRLLAIDPFNEAAHRGLMALYQRQGRASLALSQYRTLSDLLRRELSVTPEQETTRLYNDIMARRRKGPEGDAPEASETPASIERPEAPIDAPTPADIATGPATLPPKAVPAPNRKRSRLWLAAGSAVLVAVLAAGALMITRAAPPRIGAAYPIATSDGLETAPALSPDGEQVIYSFGQNGNVDLYLMPARGGGTPLQLTTHPGTDRSPAWSPDGKSVAFVRAPLSGDPRCEIIIKSLPAGDERPVGRCLTSNDTDLTWSADGRALVFSDLPRSGSAMRLNRLDLVTGRVSGLTTPPVDVIGDMSPLYSSDGQKVLFLRMSGFGAVDLMVLDLASGKERRLSTESRRVWSAVWYRHDRGIIFSADRDGDTGLWWIDDNGGKPERLSIGLTEFRKMSYSARSNRIVFEAMQDRRNLLHVPGTAAAGDRTPRPVMGLKPGLFSRFPAQSSKGDIVFVSEKTGSDELWLVPAGGEARQLTRSENGVTQDPVWSPDGSRIAFVAVRDGRSDLYMVQREGGSPVALTDDTPEDAHPAWSPDGQSLYFGSRRSGAWRIWSIRPGIKNSLHPVTGDGPWRALPSVDGRQLYYVSDDVRGVYRRALNAQGRVDGDATRVIDLNPNDWRNWAIVGNAIVYAQRDNRSTAGEIRRLDLTSGVETVVADATPLYWNASFVPASDGGLLLTKRDLQIDLFGSDLK